MQFAWIPVFLHTYPLIKYLGNIPKMFEKYRNFILSRSWYYRKKCNEKHGIALSVVSYNEAVLRLFVTHSHISYTAQEGDTHAHVLCGSDNFERELKNQREIRKNNDVQKKRINIPFRYMRLLDDTIKDQEE